MSFEFVAMEPDYTNSKDPTILESIQSTQDRIKADPYSAGDKYSGPLKMFRHAEVNHKYRIIYVICREARAFLQQQYLNALSHHDANFRACPKYCKASCIDQPENRVVLFRVMKHSEQDRVFGSRN